VVYHFIERAPDWGWRKDARGYCKNPGKWFSMFISNRISHVISSTNRGTRTMPVNGCNEVQRAFI